MEKSSSYRIVMQMIFMVGFWVLTIAKNLEVTSVYFKDGTGTSVFERLLKKFVFNLAFRIDFHSSNGFNHLQAHAWHYNNFLGYILGLEE